LNWVNFHWICSGLPGSCSTILKDRNLIPLRLHVSYDMLISVDLDYSEERAQGDTPQNS
jgi:hypothetical protein